MFVLSGVRDGVRASKQVAIKKSKKNLQLAGVKAPAAALFLDCGVFWWHKLHLQWHNAWKYKSDLSQHFKTDTTES